MALDTQQFGITRYWLSVALEVSQRTPDIFSKKNLSVARKLFLAGSNQLTAIKNWLVCARILEPSRGGISLTDLGKLMFAQDSRAAHPWTWWLFHLNLCVYEKDAFPYSTFFSLFDVDGRNWMDSDDIIKAISEKLESMEVTAASASLDSYWQGVEKTFYPGLPIYNLGLVERRKVLGDTAKVKFRKCLITPPDIIVAYATLLFRSVHFANHQTIETRILLDKGVAKCLGISNSEFREALRRIHQDGTLGRVLKYSQVANIDSVQFPAANLKSIQKDGYSCGDVVWA